MAYDIDHAGNARPVSADPLRRLASAASAVGELLVPLLFPAAVLLAWELAAQNRLISPILFPAPSIIWRSAVILFESGRLWEHVGASVALQVAGLVAGAVAGIGLGLLVGLLRAAEEVLDTTFVILQSLPTLVLIPLFIVWFGGGSGTRILVVALSVFFPVYVNTLGGIRLTDRKLIEVGRVLNFSRREIATRILIPHALPQIVVGVRQSLKMAWVGVVAVELLIASSAGIYYMMAEARSFGQTPLVYLGLLLFAAFGVLSDVAVAAAARFLIPPGQGADGGGSRP